MSFPINTLIGNIVSNSYTNWKQ